MKGIIKFISIVIFVTFAILITIQGVISIAAPDYKEGEYIMIYKVYYSSNDTKTYTIKNNLPISTESYMGVNKVFKITKIPHINKAFGRKIVIETSAPIEVVSYTYKEK